MERLLVPAKLLGQSGQAGPDAELRASQAYPHRLGDFLVGEPREKPQANRVGLHIGQFGQQPLDLLAPLARAGAPSGVSRVSPVFVGEPLRTPEASAADFANSSGRFWRAAWRRQKLSRIVQSHVRNWKAGLYVWRAAKTARKVSCTTSSASAASPSMPAATEKRGTIAVNKQVERAKLPRLHLPHQLAVVGSHNKSREPWLSTSPIISRKERSNKRAGRVIEKHEARMSKEARNPNDLNGKPQDHEPCRRALFLVLRASFVIRASCLAVRPRRRRRYPREIVTASRRRG